MINFASALFLIANGHPKFPAKVGVYALSEKGRRYAIRAWKRASVALGVITLIVNFVDPLIATLILLIGVVLATVYSTMEAERGAIMEEVEGGGTLIRPISSAKYLLFLNLVLIAIPIIALALSYPYLPDKVAVHFDLSWRPNGWMEKEGFAITLIALDLAVGSLSLWASYLAWRKPEALVKGKAPSLRYPLLMTLTEALNVVTLIYLILYNVGGRL